MIFVLRFRLGVRIMMKTWNPDVCFVRNHTTWMTSNSAQILSSHLAMEEYYRLHLNANCSESAFNRWITQ